MDGLLEFQVLKSEMSEVFIRLASLCSTVCIKGDNMSRCISDCQAFQRTFMQDTFVS